MIGNDIVEIARIKKALENSRFRDRVFTQKEIKLIEKKGINKYASYAGRFSGKEAVAKAIGSGVRDFNIKDIEILANELGKPIVKLNGKLKDILKGKRVEISISHSKEYATSVAIIF